jgi:diguanylate cyclase (GGDEF)-like protein
MSTNKESQLWSALEALTQIDNEIELFEQSLSAMSEIYPGIELLYYKIHISRNNHQNDGSLLNKSVTVLVSNYFDKKPEPKPLSADPLLVSCYHENKIVNHNSTDDNVIYVFPLGFEKEIQYLLKVVVPVDKVGAPSYLLTFFKIFINYYKVIRSNERDFLTGMYNRRAFNRVMNTLEIHHHVDHKRKSDYLVIIDIDFFKSVNDNFGHMIGDEVLILFSRVVRENIRAIDIAFRTGGEEFVIVLFDLSFENATTACERLRSTIEKTVFPQVHRLTLSGGFTKLEYPLDSFYALKKADSALYYSKDHGRNQISCYETLVESEKIQPVTHFNEVMDIW